MRPRLIAALILLPCAAAAQVAGRVTDQTGQPVAAATVEVTELGRSVLTAADGAFQLTLPPGRYTIVIRRAGFGPAVREIAVAGPQTIDVSLAPSAFRLEPVTVTATRSPVATDGSPLPVASLAGRALRRAQSVS